MLVDGGRVVHRPFIYLHSENFPFFLESLEGPFVKDEEEYLTQFITSYWQKVLTNFHKEEATCCVATFTSQLFLSCNSKHAALWRLY